MCPSVLEKSVHGPSGWRRHRHPRVNLLIWVPGGSPGLELPTQDSRQKQELTHKKLWAPITG